MTQQAFTPRVSCIVPVYNAEKYLAYGIESLLNQSYSNIEIILVDDCSTDSSWEICKTYERKHAEIKAFQTKENSGGPLRGRQLGIAHATGEWITTMDGDDYVGTEYIANLIRATCRGKYDIGVTGHIRVYEDGRREVFKWHNYTQSRSERLMDFYNHFLRNDFWTDPTDTVGQNIIRANICKSVDLSQYSNTVYAEDTLMALAFLTKAENGINFIDKHDFYWRQVPGSGSNGGFSEHANQREFYESCLRIFHKPDVYKIIHKNDPLVSIIVPVYNVEKYLVECLESISKQTYENIEVIVVNDGSTDSSRYIINKHAKTDTRFKYICQENKGLNLARAAGVVKSKGRYIAFVDSDDIVHPEYIRSMYESLMIHAVDISISGYAEFINSKEIAISDEAYDEMVIKDKKEVFGYYLGFIESVKNIYQMTAWGKLFRAEIVHGTDWQFSNYRRHEDNLESLQWYDKAERGIVATSKQLYYYRKNPTSITNKMQKNLNPEGQPLDYFEYLYELYNKIKIYKKDEAYDVTILNYFSETNRLQVRKLFNNNQLDRDLLESATVNAGKAIQLYNQYIKANRSRIDDLEGVINSMEQSLSWRVTTPLRKIKGALRQTISRFR